MKLNQSAIILVVVAIALFASSCVTPPPTTPVQPPPVVVEPTPPKPEPVPEPAPVIPEPTEARAAAEKARADALTLGSDRLYSSEWSSAEALFKEGVDSYGVDNDKSGKAYKAVLIQYQALADKAKTIVQGDLNAARSKAVAARTSANDLDAPRYFATEWEKAETDYAVGGKKASAADAGELAAYKEAITAYTAATSAYNKLSIETKPAVSDAMVKARSRADQSRKQAFDLNAATYFGSDWKKAEELYLSARSLESDATGGRASAYPAAIAEYGKAADAYDATATQTLPVFAENRRTEALNARDLAIGAGIEGLSPVYLQMADAAALAVIDLYNQGDYYGAYAAWVKARDGYISLAAGSDAYYTKERIDGRNLGAYDRGNYTLGSEKLQESLEAFEAGNTVKARASADEAVQRLGIAYRKGQEFYAVDRGKSADTERQAATSLKANVAVKAEYDAASSVLAEADAAFKAQKFDDASALYAKAESLFAIVRETAANKRAAALKALETASRQLTDSEQTARDADIVVSGGVR